MPRISMPAAALMALAASAAAFVGAGHKKKDPKATTFIAVLNAGQVDPLPADIKGMGVAFATLDDKTGEFCFSISYDEPTTRQTGAHIHGPALPGANATVIYDFSEPAGSPKHLCFGPLTKKQKRQLRAGRWYFNIHSEAYIHGEIRGQIVPVSAP